MVDRLITQSFGLRNLRNPNTIAWCGTSRISSQYQDGIAARNKSNGCWINWSDGWLRAMSRPLIHLGNFAVSGSRSDQFAVANAVATSAANVGIDGHVNDVAQAVAGYTPTSGPFAGVAVSMSNVVAAVIAQYKAHFKFINDSGARVVYIVERGAAGYTSAQIIAHNDINRLMADYIQYGDDFRGPPNVIVLDPTAQSVVTSTSSAIALKNSVDGTHDNVTASQLIGKAFADELAPFLRKVHGHKLATTTQRSGLSSRNIAQNPALSGSNAVTGNGNSGNIPNNFTLSGAGGNVSAVFTIQPTVADANGNTFGNQIKIDYTATGAGALGLVYSLDRTNLVQGSKVRSGCEIDVAAGATGLGGIYYNTEWFPSTGGTSPMIDMQASTIGTDNGGYAGFVMETDDLLFTTFTGSPFTNSQLRAVFTGAGSATVYYRSGYANRS